MFDSSHLNSLAMPSLLSAIHFGLALPPFRTDSNYLILSFAHSSNTIVALVTGLSIAVTNSLPNLLAGHTIPLTLFTMNSNSANVERMRLEALIAQRMFGIRGGAGELEGMLLSNHKRMAQTANMQQTRSILNVPAFSRRKTLWSSWLSLSSPTESKNSQARVV